MFDNITVRKITVISLITIRYYSVCTKSEKNHLLTHLLVMHQLSDKYRTSYSVALASRVNGTRIDPRLSKGIFGV